MSAGAITCVVAAAVLLATSAEYAHLDRAFIPFGMWTENLRHVAPTAGGAADGG